MVIDFDISSGKISENKDVNPREFKANNIPENPFDDSEEEASKSWWVFLAGNTLFFTLYIGQYSTPIIGLSVALFVNFITSRVLVIRQLKKKYRLVPKFTAPVFITSKFPEDESVYERTVEAEKLISLAWIDNPYAPKPPVYSLYYGDEGETEDEFNLRKETFKLDQTKAYHKLIKDANEGYYYRFILKQKGYPWQPKEQK